MFLFAYFTFLDEPFEPRPSPAVVEKGRFNKPEGVTKYDAKRVCQPSFTTFRLSALQMTDKDKELAIALEHRRTRGSYEIPDLFSNEGMKLDAKLRKRARLEMMRRRSGNVWCLYRSH